MAALLFSLLATLQRWQINPRTLMHDADFATRAQARAVIVEYIEIFSNNKRRHSSLGYVSPAEYERTE